MTRKKKIKFGRLVKKLSSVQDQVKFLQVSEYFQYYSETFRMRYIWGVWGGSSFIFSDIFLISGL